ncbi:MAG TPA: replicative DNA helicase [bacterium]|nr:replicative DNA helicase [bacterium]
MTDSLARVDPPARVSNALAEIAGRVPPQALAAEAAVLASMMLDGAAANTVVEMLEPADFYRPAHQKICDAIFRLFERNEAIDLITLTEELRRAGDLEKVGGSVYLAELLETTTSAAIVEHYAHIVRERSTLRRLARASLEIADECYSSPEDVKGLLDRAEHKVFEISESGLGKGFVSIKDILVDSFEAIERLYQNKRLITGVPSGFFDLDGYTSGFQPSEFIVIAARPSMGKTALALNVAQHVSVQQKLPVAVFSLEMSKESLVHRLLAAEARVDGTRLRTGFLHENEWPRLTTAAGRLGDADFYIDDTAGLTALEIRAKTRRLMVETKGRLALVMIDYLQLIRGHGRQENRQQEISTISRSLKALAKELRIPVIALSQLKRPTDVREGARRPMLSDLRECVVGDTLVNLPYGRRVPIRKLVGSDPSVLSMNAEGKVVEAQADLVWRVGVRNVYEVRLESGRKITATADHRLYSERGWRPIDFLRVGDRLGVADPVRRTSREIQKGIKILKFFRVTHPASTQLALSESTLLDTAEIELAWDRIVSIKPRGEQEVFDLTVPETSSWLADGIVSHNSGAIEQDADVVIFINRPEIYNPTPENEGIAEIILGKQRNGPIGTVQLSFQKAHTRFESLTRVRE